MLHFRCLLFALLILGGCSRGISAPPLPLADPSTVASPTVAPQEAAYREAATEAVEALHAMESVTTAGVSLENYSRRMGDCRIVVDRFLAKNRQSKVPGLNEAISSSLAAYQKGLDLFTEAKGDPNNGLELGALGMRGDSNLISEAIAAGGQFTETYYTGNQFTYIRIKQLLQVLWLRASSQIKIADKLLQI
mgnify:CR=1 FL=1